MAPPPPPARAIAKPRVPDAAWFAQLALNSPDDTEFERMLGMLADAPGPIDQARLRICIAVAHAALMLWYFGRAGQSAGPGLPEDYRAALRADLEKERFNVRVGDYVVDPVEREAFAATPAGRGGPQRVVGTPEFFASLLAVREAEMRKCLEADVAEPDDDFRIPFLRAGSLIVRQFAGRDPGLLPSGEILAAMIGQELAEVHGALEKAMGQPHA